MAVLIVTGIDLEGKQDILAVEPMQEESSYLHQSLWNFEITKTREGMVGGIRCPQRVNKSRLRVLCRMLLATMQCSF